MATKPPVKKRRVKRRRRRRIRKSVLYGLIGIAAAIVLVFSLTTIPKITTDNKLKSLGYSKESIAMIKRQKLTKTILNDKLYSDNLNAALASENFNKDYLRLYLVTDSLSEDDTRLYDRLRARNYPEDSCLKLFEKLNFWEITPLLVFDYVSDVDAYIQDCTDHRDVNSENHFELSGNYVHWYDSTSASDAKDVSMIVNKRYYLGENYAPDDLAPLSLTYAAKDCYLRHEAADALAAMCDELNGGGKPKMYASSSYRDYQYQVDLYNGYVNSKGQEWADSISARPGFSEHQTGLTVDMAATGAQLSKFADTEAFQWMQQNAHRFGWILRYPEGKETITGYNYEAWHYRYLGVELATKVHDSGLTYDEYYELYLR